VGAKRLYRALNFDTSCYQQFFEPGGGMRVVLIWGDEEREGPATLTCFDGAPPHLVEIFDELLMIRRYGVQQSAHGAQVVIDDVPGRPCPARPWIGKIDLLPVLRQSLETSSQIRG